MRLSFYDACIFTQLTNTDTYIIDLNMYIMDICMHLDADRNIFFLSEQRSQSIHRKFNMKHK